MDSNLQMLIMFVAIWAIIILWRRIARKNTLLGRFMRAWWNIGFYIGSLIPFMGWTANFIIADTEEEKAEKEERILAGEESDAQVWKAVEERNREEQRKQERFNDLSQQAQRKYGQGLSYYDEETGRATLKDGTPVRVERDE